MFGEPEGRSDQASENPALAAADGRRTLQSNSADRASTDGDLQTRQDLLPEVEDPSANLHLSSAAGGGAIQHSSALAENQDAPAVQTDNQQVIDLFTKATDLQQQTDTALKGGNKNLFFISSDAVGAVLSAAKEAQKPQPRQEVIDDLLRTVSQHQGSARQLQETADPS